MERIEEGMSFSRIWSWAFLLVLATTAGARADSFDGIYVNGDGGNVAYFDLLRHGDRVSGDYTVVVRNPETSGGILRSHFTVTGTTDRQGAMLTIVGDTPEAQAAMTQRLAANPQGKHGQHLYSLEEFGLTAPEVRRHFRDYCERFDIPLK